MCKKSEFLLSETVILKSADMTDVKKYALENDLVFVVFLTTSMLKYTSKTTDVYRFGHTNMYLIPKSALIFLELKSEVGGYKHIKTDLINGVLLGKEPLLKVEFLHDN